MRYAALLISVLCFFVAPQPTLAATFYIDMTCTTPGNGTSPTCSGGTAPYAQIDSFTEVARSAGDIAFVRRTATTTSVGNDLNFTSDGTIANPIIISADYDNIWGDFATSSQTYTVAIATSTLVASAAVTGIAAGDWVYVAGDCFENTNTTFLNPCEFAYEVASVSNTSVNLYLPYKGNQSGSGLDLRVMPDNPRWNIATGDFQWNFDTDNYWLVKGMDIRGTDANGQAELDTSLAQAFYDTIFTGNGASDIGIRAQSTAFTNTFPIVDLKKVRIFNNVSGIQIGVTTSRNPVTITMKDTIIDGNSVASSVGIQTSFGNGASYTLFASDSVFRRHATSDLIPEGTLPVYLRNTLHSSTPIGAYSSAIKNVFIEDYLGIVGDNRKNNYGSGSDANTSILLSTSTLRSGGGPTAIEVRPTTNTTSIWDFNKIKLFEYPIYTDTSSKQYDVYFRTATTTAEWTANPTVSELWIQCEYWAHDTNATSTRKIKKSTGTVDFAADADWQALSVTCQPTQSGVLFLSGWYAKTKESAQSNQFLVDGTPIIN